MLNVVAIQGRLTHDPELKTTYNGTNVCSFRIAVDRSYAPHGEERQTDFITVTAWRKAAEFVSKYFQKGSMISVQGRLETRQYQDKNGNNRTATEVIAAEVGFCGSKSAENPAAASYEEQTANNVREANAAHIAPQQPQNYSQGSNDDFAEISDTDNFPF